MDLTCMQGKQTKCSKYTAFSEVSISSLSTTYSSGVILDILPYKGTFVYLVCCKSMYGSALTFITENGIHDTIPSKYISVHTCPVCGSPASTSKQCDHIITCNNCTLTIGNPNQKWSEVVTCWNSFKWKSLLQKIRLNGTWKNLVTGANYPVKGWLSSEILDLKDEGETEND